MNRFIEDISKNLLTEFFDTETNTKSQKIQNNLYSNRFFKVVRHEIKRLKISARGLDISALIEIHMNAMKDEPVGGFMTYASLKNLREKVSELTPTKWIENLNLSTVLIKRYDVSIPVELGLHINSYVNGRLYEGIKSLYDTIRDKHAENISLDRIVDDIYRQASLNYTAFEFLKLSDIIPIEINRLIGNPLCSSEGVDLEYELKPFLNHVVECGNFDLAKYLIDNGADVTQLSSLIEIIDPDLQDEESDKEMLNGLGLQSIKTYLLERNSNVHSIGNRTSR